MYTRRTCTVVLVIHFLVKNNTNIHKNEYVTDDDDEFDDIYIQNINKQINSHTITIIHVICCGCYYVIILRSIILQFSYYAL